MRYAAGDYDDAIDRCQQVLEMEPGSYMRGAFWESRFWGRAAPDEAVIDSTAASGPTPRVPSRWPGSRMRKPWQARETKPRAERQLESSARTAFVPAYHLALAQSGLGDRDAAFTLLDRHAPSGSRS